MARIDLFKLFESHAKSLGNVRPSAQGRVHHSFIIREPLLHFEVCLRLRSYSSAVDEEIFICALLMSAMVLGENGSGFYGPKCLTPPRQYFPGASKAIFNPFHHSNPLPTHPYFILLQP